ncbi:Diguanylate cyclase DosC [Poriferisphaera corsica]|uniref:Diguanylate cyclase DosC n=1 Tax=Poriferisphaera corsica TaxID=2528020 RepID=A0A517YX59_9BACT|nr:sensor domain-containing diguanylate cyclase [Poriferisphaera corsica]QDU34801.1 Diguanylate cyclase DosC [Poriferisphaera corsica]
MSTYDSFPNRILDQVNDGAYFVDRERRITFWSKGAEKITGYKADQVIGRHCYDNILMHVTDCGKCLCKSGCPLQATIDDGIVRDAEIFLHHKDGHRIPVHAHTNPLRDDKGHIVGGIEVFSDESSQANNIQRLKDLEKAAMIDPLTNIANRRMLSSTLEMRFAEFKRNDWQFGVILVDIDKFKNFNDLHGHQIGDRILQLISRTMKHACRRYDLVGRWGGEEFLIVVGHTDTKQIVKTAERLRVLVNQSFIQHAGCRLTASISAGVTLALPHDTIESLVSRADQLLYESKHRGRNCVTSDLIRPESHENASNDVPACSVA